MTLNGRFHIARYLCVAELLVQMRLLVAVEMGMGWNGMEIDMSVKMGMEMTEWSNSRR